MAPVERAAATGQLHWCGGESSRSPARSCRLPASALRTCFRGGLLTTARPAGYERLFRLY